MPRKTLALIAGLVLVTIILFIIALRTGQSQNQNPPVKTAVMPTIDRAHSVLSMTPNPIDVLSGKVTTVEVNIDPSDNPVTAVQLEMLYDPTMLTNVKVTPGPLFQGGNILIDKNDAQTGKYTYAVGIQPSQNTINAKGVVATVSFVARGLIGKQSQIQLLPTSLVTARGIETSVMRFASGTTVMIGTGATPTVTALPVVTKAPVR